MTTTVIPIPLGAFGMVNAYLLRGERTILVDTGFPGSAGAILATLKRNGISAKSVSLILLTHTHIDHMGSAYDLREHIGAPVAVHESEMQSVRTGIAPSLVPITFLGRLIKGSIERRTARPFEPDIAIIRGMDLAEFGVEGKVIETPGHTAGSVSVVLPGGIAIAGDLACGGFANKKTPALAPFHEDLANVRASVKKLLKHKPNTIYVGHGGPLSAHAVREFTEHDRASAGIPAAIGR